MKLEVDRFYKTKSGAKVYIFLREKNRGDSFYGVFVQDADDDANSYNWDSDGLFSDDHTEHNIISEWSEPKPRIKLYAWMVLNKNTGDFQVTYSLGDNIEPSGSAKDFRFTRAPSLDVELEEG